ncbi:thioredoxin family protein [Microbacterium sp. NPDC056736]|uniref:thioredoxin family protein n=1 Tax=Microbacterium sp. NPDC056736 TaxID=3345932 RepID=UPI00366AC858
MSASEHDGVVKVELLYIDDCPNWVAAARNLRKALDAVGLSQLEINYRMLGSGEEADQVPFAGSPTILLDGADLFSAEGKSYMAACRLYSTPSGPAGSPTTEQLAEAIAIHGR